MDSNIYVIELDRWSIKNDGTNALQTTQGINNAITWAKANKYSTVYLTEGIYLIAANSSQHDGLIIPSNMTFEMHPNCILKIEPNKQPDYSAIRLLNVSNVNIKGGQIIGDRYNHDYGAEFIFESGSIDSLGNNIPDSSKLRSVGYVQFYKDGTQIPSNIVIIKIQGVKKGTGADYKFSLFCYDDNNTFLTSFIDKFYDYTEIKCPSNTKKYRIVISQDTNEDTKLCITNNKIYPTHEMGFGISIVGCNNILIKNVSIKDTTGDGIIPQSNPDYSSIRNLTIEDCIIDGCRRQGISIVDGRYIYIRRCLFQNIRGTDPQSGIDIEHYGWGNDIYIEDCTFKNNYKFDIINYNGVDIFIRRCNFDGQVGNTFGYNVYVENNLFNSKSKDSDAAINLNSNKTNIAGSRMFICNNIIKGYPIVGFVGGVDITNFENNIIENITRTNVASLKISGNQCYISGNKYIQTSSIIYTNNGNHLNISNEFFYKSKFELSNDDKIIITNCSFNESPIALNRHLVLINCSINLGKLNTIRKIGEDTSYFNRSRTFEMIGGIIEGETNDPNYTLINGMNANVFFRNVSFNIDRCALFLNYGFLELDNCSITFPNRYSNPSNVYLVLNAYSDSRSRISNCHIKNLSDGTFTLGVNYITGCKIEGKVEKITNYNTTDDIIYIDNINKNKFLKQFSSGTTTQRPIYATVGQQYFDKTLNKPIWCTKETIFSSNGSIISNPVWVDSNGTIV